MNPIFSSGIATVLVVDDAPHNVELLGSLLQPLYVVRAATSGQRALEVAASEPRPDLILLDIMMPEMDGYATLQRLKENPATREIPVIFVTALDNRDDERKGLELGAVDYVTKPFQPAILLARVRTHLDLKFARDRLHDENAWLETELARRGHQRELILRTVGEGIFGTDADGRISFVNPFGARLLGYDREELIGRDAHDTLHRRHSDGSDLPRAECPLTRCLQTRQTVSDVEQSYRCKDDTLLAVEMTCQPVIEADEMLGAVVSFRDITEKKRYLAELERKATTDDLTGLPNRNLLADRLTQAIAQSARSGKPLAVMVLNLDRFKSINDSLGREAGDAVLIEVAKRLAGQVPPEMTLARMEGDEFVLVLDVGDADAARLLVEPLLAAVAAPFLVDGHEVYLTASVGVALYPRDGERCEMLLRNAEAALARSKVAGGNRFEFYAAEMNALALERLDLENGLRHAIDAGELVLYYQPQVSLGNGSIVGAEALVRWRHPTRGLLAPAEFIPLAEKSGLIVPLGEWVLRTACTQNRAWQTAGVPPLRIGVNLSARQVEAQDIVELAARVLHETGLEARFLEVELTETMVMADADAFIHASERLKGLAITLSIDDFGTGFSSLSYLKRFAIDRLKIDQSFVQDLTQDPNSAAITQAIISLAHSLGLLAIAEGVETEAQLGFLRTHHCDQIQGFYFSQPLPAEEFAALLRAGRPLALPESARGPAKTILLVDDEPSILAALRRLLRRDGYTIHTAESGSAGLELLAQHPVSVVISDARMPEMSGAEFLGRVREMYPDTVRIMLSGYTDFEAVTSAVNRGELFRFLTKPWEDDALREVVREAFLLHEQRRARPSRGQPNPAGVTQ